MDVTLLIICLVSGGFLAMLGLRNSVVSILAICFNLAVFVDLLTNGLTEQIGLGASVTEVTYNSYPIIVLPAFFIILSVIKVVKYR